MTQYYVYRGVTYTKDGEKKTLVKNAQIEKLYRGAKYLTAPVVKHEACDHVYRGAHYMA